MVPGAGIEPARPKGPEDFKSSASTCSATRAWKITRSSEGWIKVKYTGNEGKRPLPAGSVPALLLHLLLMPPRASPTHDHGAEAQGGVAITGFTPITPSDAVTRRAYYYYVLRCDQKYWAGVPTKSIQQALAADLMGSVETIYVPIHQSPLFQPLTKKRFHLSDEHVARIKRSLAANLPHTDEASRTIVSMPHQVLLADRSDMRLIIDAFAKVAAQKDQLTK